MIWQLSHRADAACLPFVAAHYSRQKPDSSQFVPPGRCLVFKVVHGGEVRAVWVTAYPESAYVRHAWAGAWVNSMFRNCGAGLSSELIRDAVAATRHEAVRLSNWGDAPPLGLVTFVHAGKVRRKRDPGRCYLRAGFRFVGKTKGGLLAFQLPPEEMPEAAEPYSPQQRLFAVGRSA